MLLQIIKSQSKLLFNNRVSLFATIALPIALTFLFSSVGGNGDTQKSLYVSDLDKSTVSQQLETMIAKAGNLKIVDSSADEIKKALDDQKIDMGLVIGEGYGEDTSKLEIVKNYDSSDNQFLSQVIQRENSELQTLIANSKYAKEQLGKFGVESDVYNSVLKSSSTAAGLGIDEKSYSSAGTGVKEIDATSRALIGFLVLFLWFIVMQGCRTILEEKENNTYTRILSTPVKYSTFMLGKCISIFLYGAFHILVVLVAGKYIFNLGILDNVGTVSVILGVYLFALISLTMIIISFTKTQQQYSTLLSILVIVTGMLGGTFFPLDIAPDFIKTLSNFTPQAWAMTGLIDSIVNNSAISAEMFPIGILLAIGVVGAIISAFGMNRVASK